MLTLKILGAVIALGVGIWLGLPGRYDQSLEDLDRSLDEPARRSRKVKRHFTPMAWVQRRASARSARRAGAERRRGFRMEAPEDR